MEKNYDKLLDIFEEISTSIAGMMDAQPINLAGKEMPSKYGKEKEGRREKKALLGYKYKKIRRKEG